MMTSLAIRMGAVVFLLSTCVWGQDEFYLSDPVWSGTVAGREQGAILLSMEALRRLPPKARGVLIYDAVPGVRLMDGEGAYFTARDLATSNAEVVVTVVLEESLAASSQPCVVLGDRLYQGMLRNIHQGLHQGGLISFVLNRDAESDAVFHRTGDLFSVPPVNRHDLRLTTLQKKLTAQVQGEVTSADITRITHTLFLKAQDSILDELLRVQTSLWPRILEQWPGRHPVMISASAKMAAVYYAPDHGYQFEKRAGWWMIVGG